MFAEDSIVGKGISDGGALCGEPLPADAPPKASVRREPQAAVEACLFRSVNLIPIKESEPAPTEGGRVGLNSLER